jgi:hypothetical protein
MQDGAKAVALMTPPFPWSEGARISDLQGEAPRTALREIGAQEACFG